MSVLSSVFGRGAIGRALLSSFVATLSDYLFFSTLVEFGAAPGLATLMGCAVGAVINFSINRWWSFGSSDSLVPAILRYVAVSGSSAIANAMLVSLATAAAGLSAGAAWVFARALVFLTLTYPLFRSWVFGVRHRSFGVPSPELHGASEFP
ncbi:MAG: GtrA family protein [Myxococcales bacterium]